MMVVEQEAGDAELQQAYEDDDKLSPFAAPLPEKEYELALERVVRVTVWKRRVLFGHFKVLSADEHLGRVVLRFWNVPSSAYLPRTSSLFRDYLAVFGKRPPMRPFDPTWAFGGCRVLGVVRTVDMRVEKGERVPMADAEKYSKIERLVAFVSGRSPALAGMRPRPLLWNLKKSKATTTDEQP
jgi:hypothetical protein